MIAPTPHLAPSDVEALHIAALELGRHTGQNVMARHVSLDIAELADAADSGPRQLLGLLIMLGFATLEGELLDMLTDIVGPDAIVGMIMLAGVPFSGLLERLGASCGEDSRL